MLRIFLLPFLLIILVQIQLWIGYSNLQRKKKGKSFCHSCRYKGLCKLSFIYFTIRHMSWVFIFNFKSVSDRKFKKYSVTSIVVLTSNTPKRICTLGNIRSRQNRVHLMLILRNGLSLLISSKEFLAEFFRF